MINSPVTVLMEHQLQRAFTVNGNTNFSSRAYLLATTHTGTHANITGILTAGSYVGSAVNLSSLPVIDDGKSNCIHLLRIKSCLY